ncbi:hypothetical protein ACKE5C_19145 (plasmid) [Aneurinibacillus thermoaerophilus]|uniref:Uncharacterized protein n=1 Tax=Aneurinibacillus thermoaerophilus TaxID=143495 RepID=A0ABX8YG31_ANETH|nr:hypothetical protein [Aneurinibacillus thermoaerophilus]QYY44776.1 hypothetical protein K3F53_18755 [Aneurinibacillus thermoaerophilus]
MAQRFNPVENGPIIVNGRLISPGSFYDAPEHDFVTTDNPETENQFVIPGEKDITVEEMKKQLTEWGVDFSGHDKNKSTLYAFYVEEAKKRVAG